MMDFVAQALDWFHAGATSIHYANNTILSRRYYLEGEDFDILQIGHQKPR